MHMGVSPKWVKSKKRRKKKKKRRGRLNYGDNNGQATHGARMAHASRLGQLFRTWEFPRSGSKAKDRGKKRKKERAKIGENNGQATHGARKPPGPIFDYNMVQIAYGLEKIVLLPRSWSVRFFAKTMACVVA